MLFADLVWSNFGFMFIRSISGTEKILYIASIAYSIAGIAVGIVVSLLTDYIIKKHQKNGFSKFFKNNAFGIVLFLIYIIKFIYHVKPYVHNWQKWCYVTDYSMGFASRFLSGQILTWITGGFISDKLIYWICIFATIILLLIVAIMANSLVKNSEKDSRLAIYYLFIIYVACPIDLSSFFMLNLGKLELYGLIFSLIAVVLFNKIKNDPVRYFILTIAGVLGIAFHQGYAFLYYCIIVVVMIYDIFSSGKFSIKKLILGIGSLFVNIATFLYFQFFSKVKFSSAQEMIDALSKKTDFEIEKSPIELEYFSPFSDSYKLVQEVLDNNYRLTFMCQLFALIPLLLVICYYLFSYFDENKKLMISDKEKKHNSVVFALCLLTMAAIVPQFILNMDWGRWLIAILFDLYFIIFYFAYKKDAASVNTLKRMSAVIKKYPVLFVLLIIPVSFLGIVGTFDMSDEAVNICSFFFNILYLIQDILGKVF